MLLEHFGITDEGKVRTNNEDSLLTGEGADETLFVVADGIGGLEAGEVASGIAVDTLKETGPSRSLEEAIQEANERILTASRSDEKLTGMGTTVVAVRFPEFNELPEAEVAHVGDSRAYLLRGGRLDPITEDHSLVAQLVRRGDITRAQASKHPQRNLITRALGNEEKVEVDTTRLPVESGDRIILCSDGLTDMVPEDRIFEILSDGAPGPERAAKSLLSAALQAGGTDNITIVIVDIKDEPSEERPRRSGTTEMAPVRPPTRRAKKAAGAEKSRRGRHNKVGTDGSPGFLKTFIRAIAALTVLLLLLSPVYMWGNSRYYLAYDRNEVVVYQGLPYQPLGIPLSREYERTGIREAEIAAPYRDEVSRNRLYSLEEIESVVRGLEA